MTRAFKIVIGLLLFIPCAILYGLGFIVACLYDGARSGWRQYWAVNWTR